MTDKINTDNLPEVLTPDLIEILAKMANEFPKMTFEWNNISILLEKRGQLKQVLDRAFILQVEKQKKIESLMTQEELDIEAKKRKESIDGIRFSGNMGETGKY
jgi:hypothetical protein